MNNSSTRYIVTCIDRSDHTSWKPQVLSVCVDMEEAEAFVRNDMESYVDNITTAYRAKLPDLRVDFEAMDVWSDEGVGCSWNISEVQI